MGSFLSAIKFLTIIPIRTKPETEAQLAQAAAYFPLTGLFLGIILVGLNLFFTRLLFEPLLINAILVVALMLLTGGLHLDGLADTFDALSSGKDRQRLLEIMREPHIGTMGVLSLICAIILKIAILSSLNLGAKNITLIFMCVLSRWSLILPLYLFNYARLSGKAKCFFGALSLPRFITASLITLLFVVLVWGWKGLSAFTIALAVSYFFNAFMNKKIGGISGDILGATVELNEVSILLLCLLICRV